MTFLSIAFLVITLLYTSEYFLSTYTSLGSYRSVLLSFLITPFVLFLTYIVPQFFVPFDLTDYSCDSYCSSLFRIERSLAYISSSQKQQFTYKDFLNYNDWNNAPILLD